MQEKDLNLENKAIITMAQFKEYEELKENVGKIKIEIGDFYVNYHNRPRFSKFLSLDTENIPNEILGILKPKIDEINKYQISNTELNIERDKAIEMNTSLENVLKSIQSKWWYKLFN